MGKINELSNQKRQMVVDLQKSGNGSKKCISGLNKPLTTVRAIIKKFQTFGRLAWKRTQVHVVLTHSEEDGEGGKEPPKVPPQFKTFVASEGHNVSKSTIRHHLHTNRLCGMVAQRKPSLRSNQQIQAFGICRMSLELSLEHCALVI